MIFQRRFIYLCNRNVTLSCSSSISSNIYCNHSKRAVTKMITARTVMMKMMPSGRICNNIARRFYSRCFFAPSLVPPTSHNDKDNHLQKSFSSVTAKHNAPPDLDAKGEKVKKRSERSKKAEKTKPVNPMALKQAITIKKLHKENKKLFGELLESKQEKVMRETKLIKAIKKISKKRNEDDEEGEQRKVEEVIENRKMRSNVFNNIQAGGTFPRGESIRLEHASVSINKNRKGDDDALQDNKSVTTMRRSTLVRAHKGAEIEWTLRNAPTKTRLIELATASAATTSSSNPNPDENNVDDEEGHISAREPLQNGRLPSSNVLNSSPRLKLQFESPETAAANKGEPLPSVEQLINSFYGTDDRQLRPRSETRKILGGNSLKSKIVTTEENESFSETQKQRTKGNDFPFSLPYYNPERDPNFAGEDKENDYAASNAVRSGSTSQLPKRDVDGGGDEANVAESMITSFPFPSRRHLSSSSSSMASSGIVDSDNSHDNKLIMTRSESCSQEDDDEQQRQKSLQLLTSTRVPSVSKILNATMPEEQVKALKRWEQKMIAEMGEEGFRQYKESILTNGKGLHSNIETFLRGTPIEDITVASANQGHWNSLSGVITSIDHVHVLESHVIHPQLQYCGVIDCVAEFRNRLVLIDWKTSQKPKPFVSMTYDTPLQIAAYVGAINYDPKYSLKINEGMIVVAYEDGSTCQTFFLNSMDLGKYWKLWLKRLQQFRQVNTPR